MNTRKASRFDAPIAAIIRFLIVFSLFVPQAFSGTLDSTFAGGGKFTTDFPFTTSSTYSSFGYAIFVQPLGRIVGAGIHFQPGPDGNAPGVAMAGITSAGVIDTTFSGGKTLDWDQITSTSLSDAQMLSDGRILRLSQYFRITGMNSVKLIRTNVDGSIDAAFAPDLTINGNIPYPGKIALLNNGKILVLVEHSSTRRRYLIRLNSDGSRDTTFGTDGAKELPRLYFNSQTDPVIIAMQVLPNGKILIAGGLGYSFSTSDFSEFFIARMDSDGNMDHSFGRLGLVRQTFGGQRVYPTDLLVQPEGKYVITGIIKNPDMDTLMVRFTQRGRLDYSFGSGGTVVTDFTVGGDDYIGGATLSNTGKIIVAGSARILPSTFSNFLLARFSANGTLEAHTQTAFTPSQNSGAEELRIQPDGKILVIGYTRNPNASVNGNVFAIARYTDITND